MTVRIIRWTAEMSVGHEQFDEDHKKLIALTNKLVTAFYAGVGKAVIEDSLAEVKAYTVYHFEREEAFLAEIDYPDRLAHIQSHSQFIKEVNALSLNEAGGALISLLSDWLISHIQKVDVAYCRYVAEKVAEKHAS